MKKAKVEKKHKNIKGIVVSDAMDKTIVVSVTSFKTHPKYLKKYKSTKKYKVHDAENKHKVGDVVEFMQVKPISKDKKFEVA
ncbi:MAG: 30S ribosomal protein S17 [Candidatus Moranbacteria bacterium]|nr:30S ribosomal protein S17 [Candidatus Moranbacteria bacterium]